MSFQPIHKSYQFARLVAYTIHKSSSPEKTQPSLDMGQKHSTMPLGDALKHPITLWPPNSKRAVRVKMSLPHPAKGTKEWTLVVVAAPNDKYWLYPSDQDVTLGLRTRNITDFVDHSWSPRSTMLDEEWANGRRVQRGQGVGAILIDSLHVACYPRWVGKTTGLELHTFDWFHSADSETLLRTDLGLGYDVLILAGANAEHKYCLKDPDTDDAPTDSHAWIHEDASGTADSRQ